MNKEIVGMTFDGLKLQGRIDAPDNPKAVAIVVHGAVEHYGRYDYITEKLLAAGYAVVRFDHRGHGRSEGKRAYYSDRTEIVKDTDIFVELAMAEFPGLPTYMIGHSMGGFASISYAITFPGKIGSYVLSGATAGGNVFSLDDSLPDDLYFPNELGVGDSGASLCSDPAVIEAYYADPLVGKEMSVGLTRVIGQGAAWIQENISVFCDPVLVINGGNDAMAMSGYSAFFEGISSTDKSLFIFAGLGHEVFNEFIKDRVIRDTIEWMDDRFPA